jgi:hypothetical protein
LWVDDTTTQNHGGEGSTRDLNRIFQATIPTHTYRLPLNSRIDVRGTDLACWFQVSRRVDPGHKAILCTDADAQGPLPGSLAVFVSDRVFAFVTIGANRVVSKITLLHKRRPK